MKKLLFILMLLPMFAMGQLGHLSFGIGTFDQKGLTEDAVDRSHPMVSIAYDADFIQDSDFVFGPFVKANSKTGGSMIPNITFGGLTGFDDGKYRFVAGLTTADSQTNNMYKKMTDDVGYFRGIATIEIGVNNFFVRGEWFTNLETYYYSHAVQVGWRLKL